MAKSQKLFSFVRKNSLAILLLVVVVLLFAFAFSFSVKREGFAEPTTAKHTIASAKHTTAKPTTAPAKPTTAKPTTAPAKPKIPTRDEAIKICMDRYNSNNYDQQISDCVHDYGYIDYLFPPPTNNTSSYYSPYYTDRKEK